VNVVFVLRAGTLLVVVTNGAQQGTIRQKHGFPLITVHGVWIAAHLQPTLFGQPQLDGVSQCLLQIRSATMPPELFDKPMKQENK